MLLPPQQKLGRGSGRGLGLVRVLGRFRGRSLARREFQSERWGSCKGSWSWHRRGLGPLSWPFWISFHWLGGPPEVLFGCAVGRDLGCSRGLGLFA